MAANAKPIRSDAPIIDRYKELDSAKQNHMGGALMIVDAVSSLRLDSKAHGRLAAPLRLVRSLLGLHGS